MAKKLAERHMNQLLGMFVFPFKGRYVAIADITFAEISECYFQT